ncbi:MAG: response regulator [Candidatus Aureabacteria bacterium]|nr:response regulator [Candidatus Auribacterota bacterium]
MNILLVDDEEIIRKSLGDFLSKTGHTVFTAADEEAALDLLRRKNIDVGIFDFAIKDKDGIKLLCQAKLINPDAKYIIITGVGSMWNAAESFHCGAFSFIKKPLDLTNLLSTLNKIKRSKDINTAVERIRTDRLEG